MEYAQSQSVGAPSIGKENRLLLGMLQVIRGIECNNCLIKI